MEEHKGGDSGMQGLYVMQEQLEAFCCWGATLKELPQWHSSRDKESYKGVFRGIEACSKDAQILLLYRCSSRLCSLHVGCLFEAVHCMMCSFITYKMFSIITVFRMMQKCVCFSDEFL